MISVEVRVNGSLIAAINAVNRRFVGSLDAEDGPECLYEWTSAVFPMGMSGPAETFGGTLTHTRGLGALELIRLMCEAHIALTQKRKRKPAAK